MIVIREDNDLCEMRVGTIRVHPTKVYTIYESSAGGPVVERIFIEGYLMDGKPTMEGIKL